MAAIQFNLLPDIKLKFVKARRTKYLMMLISSIIGAAALFVLLSSLLMVNVVQKKSIADLNKDIKKYGTELKATKDLDKILTVQNQLSTLTSLHEDKPVASRMFSYISSVTPVQASLDKLSADFTAHTISVSGKAPALDVISVYTDTLKGTKYYANDETQTKAKAFSDVVLSSFGRDDKGANFTITLSYDPALFLVTSDVHFVIPTATTTNQTNLFGAGN
ncbi:MAG: hypothetical protein WAQ24_04590 [Candidatus Saccharimonadales bacterium]